MSDKSTSKGLWIKENEYECMSCNVQLGGKNEYRWTEGSLYGKIVWDNGNSEFLALCGDCVSARMLNKEHNKRRILRNAINSVPYGQYRDKNGKILYTEEDISCNITEFSDIFSDQTFCIEYLETLRWQSEYKCPLCDSAHVFRKKDSERVGRWRCSTCHSSYNVLSGTTMSKTRVPLPKWFAAIFIMVTAKKKVSGRQLGRVLDLTRQTALRLQHIIRKELVTERGEMSEHDIRFVESISRRDGYWLGQWQVIPLLAKYLTEDE